jgi:superfamily II DNA/RNA helicase
VLAAIDELMKLQQSDPEGKVVVFSQFTSFLAVLERHLTASDISSTKIIGSMSQKARKASLAMFAAPDGPLLFVCSKQSIVITELVKEKLFALFDLSAAIRLKNELKLCKKTRMSW